MGTNPTYYAKLRNVKFMGVPAMDMPSFYIRPYLRQAADFINDALKEGGEGELLLAMQEERENGKDSS